MSNHTELSLKVSGMHCASCVATIEKNIGALEGVSECRVNMAMNSAAVNFDEAQVTASRIIDKIKSLGYEAEIGRPDILVENKRTEAGAQSEFYTSLLLTVPLMLVSMWPMITSSFLFSVVTDGVIQALLAAVVLFYAGRSILKDAFVQTIHFRANMNSLIGIGTMAAFCWSLYLLVRLVQAGSGEALYFDSAAMIITLIMLGRFLEARSKGRAGQAIKALMKLRPNKATAIINNVELEIDPASAQPGMILLVKPGERIPADGEIIEGDPVIDESMLTGESMPVEKSPGQHAIGGSLNGNRSFKLKVTTAGESSFLSQIIRLVSDAQSRKAPVQRIADRVASVFVPIVLGIAALTFVLWYLLGSASNELIFKHVVSVLIIACPCALGLATPTAILAGTGRAAREGIIIRGGDILESLTRVDTVLFDKTGTLTHGKLEVMEIHTFGRISERNLIRIVGSAEAQSEHPIGEAIYRYMKAGQIESAKIKNLEARPGFGLIGECDGRHLVIGNKLLMEAEKISFGQAMLIGNREMEKGRTVVFAAMDHQVAGILSLSDRPRPEARDVVTALKKQMRRLDMLSGDTHMTAGAIAGSVGLEHFQAEVKPDQKKFIVDSYHKAGYRVAMVGDGINDAPALAAAEVGVAVSGGTDIAMESADVVLVSPELTSLLRMFSIARATMKIIKQNLFWAFFYNITAIPLAAGLFYQGFGISLSPVIAAGAMAFSSIFVVANSLRLNKLRLLTKF